MKLDTTLNNMDFSKEIETVLAQLNAIARMSDDYLAKIDDKSLEFVKKTRNNTASQIENLTSALEENNNMEKVVNDIQVNILDAGMLENSLTVKSIANFTKDPENNSLNLPSNILSSHFGDQLYNLRDATADTVTQFMEIKNNNGVKNVAQNTVTSLIGSIENFDKEVIKSMQVETLFKKADELINYQSILNKDFMSKDLIENLDFWSDDLENIRDIFKLDDNGVFSKDKFTNLSIQNVLEDFGHGELLNDLLPDNFNKISQNMLRNLRAIDNDEINALLDKLPTNFEDMIPTELMQNFGQPMLGIYDNVKQMIDIGATLPTEIIGAFKEFPTNIMDCLKTAQGQLTTGVQDTVQNVLDGVMNLGQNELNKLMSVTNIKDYINDFTDLNNMKEMFMNGDLDQIINKAGDLSGMIGELQNNITNLPESLTGLVSNLPDNITGIVNNLGGIPAMDTFNTLTNTLTSQVDNISGMISGNISNLSNLAQDALKNGLGMITSMFNWGNNEGVPGVEVPKHFF